MAVHSLFYPPSTAAGKAGGASKLSAGRDVLIFFISGNPGLIDYYQPFFSSLRQLLDSSPSCKSTRFYIYGQDLAGFNDADHEPFNKKNPPRDVEYQIRCSFEALSRLRVPPPSPVSGSGDGDGAAADDDDKPYDEVILAGHSVGSYVALEMLHRMATRQPGFSGEAARHLRPRAGFLLFPTIEHIRLSPQGVRLDLLRRIPVLGPSAHLLAWGFLRPWPAAALRWFVGNALGFPPHAADVTTRFLKSRDGIWQALHMGMDEMRVIGEDRWDDTLWNEVRKVAEAEEDASRAQDGKPLPRFFFFFGKEDHWVASHLRDAFIARSQERSEHMRMMVDEGNLPHAFCLRKFLLYTAQDLPYGKPAGHFINFVSGDSETVAEKVLLWISEMYEEI